MALAVASCAVAEELADTVAVVVGASEAGAVPETVLVPAGDKDDDADGERVDETSAEELRLPGADLDAEDDALEVAQNEAGTVAVDACVIVSLGDDVRLR